jgi:hypothetical protein
MFYIIVLSIILLVFYGVSKPKDKKKNLSRQGKAKIETELVPMAMHGINVRSRVDYKTWMKIAHKSHYLNMVRFKLPQHACEVCKSNGYKQGFEHPLEAHEEWSFDHDTRTQKLTRIRSLCPLCHKAVHIGLADKQGYGERVRKHMARVNGWTADQVEAHIAQAKDTVRAMNQMGQYKLDLTYLNDKRYAGTHHLRFTTNETNNCQAKIYE